MWVKQAVHISQYGDGTGGTIFHGDATLLRHDLAPYMGTAALVYMDPPYLTGDAFDYRIKIGTEGILHGKPEICLPAYSDKFPTKQAYMALLHGLCTLGRDLLCDTGTLFLHLDPRMSAYAKVMLDELMGEAHFVNEIIWAYESGGRASRHFSRKHDVILMYRKNKDAYFDITQAPISRSENRHNHMRRQVDEGGRTFYTIKAAGRVYTYYEDTPVYPGDVWTDISHLQQKDPTRTGYATQKPMKLLERILRVASRPGDLVCDLCFGSGTTLACAVREGRRFLGVDASPSALAAVGKRLMGVEYTSVHQADMGRCTLKAAYIERQDYCEIILEDFSFSDSPLHSPKGYSAKPLDLADRWSAGLVRGGVFYAAQSHARSKTDPILHTGIIIPKGEGQPAMEIIDILSRRHVFVWRQDD